MFNPYDLVALDLDGTLLGPNGQISHANHEAVTEVQKRGLAVVLATARPPRAAIGFARSLGLTTPLIAYNGALVVDAAQGNVIQHTPLQPPIVAEIVALARQLLPRVVVHLEVEDRAITDWLDERFTVASSREFPPDVLGPLDEHLLKPVTKLMLMQDASKLAQIESMIRQAFADRVQLHHTDAHLLQIVAPGVDKAASLKQLAAAQNVPAKRVLAIGDAPNDAGMLAWAGLGVAMGNAHPALLDAADDTTLSHDADGVAAALHQHILARSA